MPFLGIHGTSSSIPTEDTDPPLVLLATKKRLIRPYSSSHIKASLRRLDRDAVPERSKTALARTTTPGSKHEGVDKKMLMGKAPRASSACCLLVSTMKTRARSAECKSVNDIDDELEIDYRKIEDEDPDRMTESDVYQRVRKLNTKNNYEHEALRGGISPSIVQASKRLQASKYAGVTKVVRIGTQYQDGLKVKGVPVEMKMKLDDADALSTGSDVSEEICMCQNCQKKQIGSGEVAEEKNDDEPKDLKSDMSPLTVVSISNDASSPYKEISPHHKNDKTKCLLDRVKAQERKERVNKMPVSRCSSAKSHELLSPTTVKIDSNNLPIMTPRSITGPRMRYEVTSSLGRKTVEDDRDLVSRGSNIDLTTQIETVARAQDIIDHNPKGDERVPKYPEVQLFSWRPALKDILRSKSVSLRRRSMDCIYMDSTSSAKCLKHGKHCHMTSPRTMQDESISWYPSSQVSRKDRRLKISIDMRSVRLPPITNYSPRSLERASTSCVGCVVSV